MSMVSRFVPLVAAAMMAMFVAHAADAKQPPEPTYAEQFADGVRAYEEGKLDFAQLRFEAALRLRRGDKAAQGYMAKIGHLQKCVESAFDIVKARRRGRKAARARKRHERCRRALGRRGAPAKLGTNGALYVVLLINGADILIDGKKVAIAPMTKGPLVIPPGTYKVTVTMRGWGIAEDRFVVLPGLVTDVLLTITPVELIPIRKK